jgi:hypothetical protein
MTVGADPIFVDSVLARRMELAEAEGGVSCGAAMARENPESGACVETIAGGSAVFTGIGSPITQATGVGLDGPVSAEEFARLENFFFSRGAAVNLSFRTTRRMDIARRSLRVCWCGGLKRVGETRV